MIFLRQSSHPSCENRLDIAFVLAIRAGTHEGIHIVGSFRYSDDLMVLGMGAIVVDQHVM